MNAEQNSSSLTGEDQSEDDSTDTRPVKKRREPVAIQTNSRGQPLLPDMDDGVSRTLQWKKDMVRAYVTAQYREFHESIRYKINI